MPYANAPQTHAIGTAIVAYLAALTYTGGAKVYTGTQLEAFKDLTDLVANNGACCEVYGNQDDSDRRGFGGRIWDTQSWFLVSIVSLATPASSASIYDVRDALVFPFQLHATLGGTVNTVFQSELKANSGKFGRVLRNGEWYRSYLCELETKQEWVLPIPPGVVS